MSENSTAEERTEMPTDRRMQMLRREGQIHMSQDVVQVLTLMMGFYVLQFVWQSILNNLKLIMVKCYTLIGQDFDLTTQTLYSGSLRVLPAIIGDIVVITVCVSAVAFFAVMFQTKWNIKKNKINFNVVRLNPLAGLKKIFSISQLVQTLKAIFKLALILPLSYFALEQFIPEMVSLMHTSIEFLFTYTGRALHILYWRIMYILIAFAIFDYFWGRYQWMRQNKMTKNEVKDERKAVEGDEATKRKIISKGMTRIAERIRFTVPKASVVVTNPTHYAVALKYERGKSEAPIVVAKGKGFKALRIREIARESGVPVLERKSLARALFNTVEVGAQIPYELFKAVAEVFAYIYKLKNPWANSTQSSKTV